MSKRSVQGSPQRMFHLHSVLSSGALIFCIILRHFNHCLVLSHRIHRPILMPSRFEFTGSSILSILFPNKLILFPPYVQTTSVLPVVFFLSKPSHLCCPSGVLTGKTKIREQWLLTFAQIKLVTSVKRSICRILTDRIVPSCRGPTETDELPSAI